MNGSSRQVSEHLQECDVGLGTGTGGHVAASEGGSCVTNGVKSEKIYKDQQKEQLDSWCWGGW